MFVAAVYSFLATPIYQATTTVLIEEEGSKILDIEDTFGYQRRIYSDLRFFNTQLHLLQSKSLAERVAKKMSLLTRAEFGAGKKNKKSLISTAKDILTLAWLRSKNRNDENNGSSFSQDPYLPIATRVTVRLKLLSPKDWNGGKGEHQESKETNQEAWQDRT